MLFLYGDSHAHYSFKGLSLPYEDRHEKSITMFRVGRDRQIIHYYPHEHDETSVSCVVYGEVDCRCHIHRQRMAGREEDDVILELVTAYINTICEVIRTGRGVIVVAVIPPTRQTDYEAINGPIRHEFPFVGSDEERVRYTTKVNHELEKQCRVRGLWFIDPYSAYKREDGTLRFEESDQLVHVGNTESFLSEFTAFYEQMTKKGV
jgi:hypothetical protein